MKLSDEQRAGLALLLMVLVLMLWSRFYKPPVPPKAPETNPPAASVQQPSTVGPGTGNTQTAAAQGGAPGREAAAATVPVKEAKSEQTIIVESGLYRVELSNRGGVVRSWKLNKYHDNENPPRPLDLVNTAAAEQLKAWPLSVRLDRSETRRRSEFRAVHRESFRCDSASSRRGGFRVERRALASFEATKIRKRIRS